MVRLLYALSALRLSGRRRGRPSPARGTRILSMTGSNCVQSARSPGATVRDRGRQRPSALRWTLVVNPPRERPRPSPAAPRRRVPEQPQPGFLAQVFCSYDPLEQLGAGGGVLRAPAACWWARITVESTQMSQSIAPSASAAPWACWNSRSQVPSADQSRWRSYTVFHGPNRSGRSRHGTPVRTRCSIPLTT